MELNSFTCLKGMKQRRRALKSLKASIISKKQIFWHLLSPIFPHDKEKKVFTNIHEISQFATLDLLSSGLNGYSSSS